MPLSDSAPQLSFLKESADSLHSLSPSTAAHLLTVHNHILHSHFKPLNQKQHDSFCGACGNIRAAEWTKTRGIKKNPGSGASKRTSGGGATVYECLRCHRRTVKHLRREPIRPSTTETRATTDIHSSTSTSTLTAPALQQGSEVTEGSKAAKTAENASSKKRAKARKGGLQALLASKQQSQQSSLDLFDFLQ